MRKQHGFTLVELLVVAPVVMVTIVLTLSYLFNQYGQLTQQGVQLNLQSEAQTILFTLQDDLTFASEFSSSKDSSLSDSYAPGGGWNYNTTPSTLIVLSPATTASHRSANRETVYINQLGCTPNVDIETMQNNPVAFNNIIYFASGTNLYKRILAPTSGTNMCGSPYLRQSCPAANASPTCPKDILLTDKLNTFTVAYYDQNNNVINTPESSNRVKVTIQLKDKAYAEDVFGNSSISIRKLNY